MPKVIDDWYWVLLFFLYVAMMVCSIGLDCCGCKWASAYIEGKANSFVE